MRNFDLRHGDCLEVMKSLPDCSVDAIVTDPPYGLNNGGNDLADVFISEFFDVFLPNLNKTISKRFDYLNFPIPPDRISFLNFVNRSIFVEPGVGVEKGSIDFNNDFVDWNKEIKNAGKSSPIIPDWELMKVRNSHIVENGNKFFLKVRNCLNSSLRDGSTCGFTEFGFGRLGVFVVIPFDSCFACFLRSSSPSASGGIADIVRLLNDPFAFTQSPACVMTRSGAEIRAVLTFDMRLGTVEIKPADTAFNADLVFEIVSPHFVGAGSGASCLSPMFKSFDFGVIGDSANRTFSVGLHSFIIPKINRESGGFMGKRWDYDVPSVEVWAECLRVLKPGGHLLAFFGTRTYHRGTVRIEDAGFEIRDMLGWLYGCLDDQSEVVTQEGIKPYHKTKIGDNVLCYDSNNKTYSYQPILEIVEYDYSDTAYRLVGDFGEQIVSRNHRVIVERDGKEEFCFAENLSSEERIPILESLPALQQAIYDVQPLSSSKKKNLRGRLCGSPYQQKKKRKTKTISRKKRTIGGVRVLRNPILEAECLASKIKSPNLQQSLQWEIKGQGMVETCQQRSILLENRIRSKTKRENDGKQQPFLERWFDLQESQGCLLIPANKICKMPSRFARDGSQGWLCYGASVKSGIVHREDIDKNRVCPSHQPRCNRQSNRKLNAVCNKQRTQTVRAWSGHKTHLVRVVPFHYTGKVWCLRVPTGSFVAFRNGVAFPTGNSGFPKSLDVSKAIDKAAGAEREKVRHKPRPETSGTMSGSSDSRPWIERSRENGYHEVDGPIPATDAARQWQGWGTALKPAHEPICLARKPLIGTVAENVLEHGTGAINVDGCRVEGPPWKSHIATGLAKEKFFTKGEATEVEKSPHDCGRWPANIIHDGSEEVLGVFPTQGEKSESRFFYCPKASKADRGADNKHPTVKPTDLMRYLCRLITPPGGLILDPFMGSGSTGVAAITEGFRFFGIEREQEHFDYAMKRISELKKDETLF